MRGELAVPTYSQVRAAWESDPEGFWMAAARAIDWQRAPTRALDASRAPFYGWFSDAVCNTCHNAVDRHVAAGHGDRLAIIHEFADHRDAGGDQLRRAARPGGAAGRRAGGPRDRQGRPGHRLHADGARGAGGDAGLRPARGDPLGGLRRLRRARARGANRRRPAEGGDRRLLRPRAGAGHRLQAAGRRRHRAGAAQAGVLPDPAAPAGPGGARAAATWTGRLRRTGWRPRPARRSAAWIRSISSTRRGPPASPRGWCGPTPGTWWRWPGR